MESQDDADQENKSNGLAAMMQQQPRMSFDIDSEMPLSQLLDTHTSHSNEDANGLPLA